MKKGFTLIEILAVIIVLALVSVIAAPSLIGVINKSRLNALKSSAYGLINASNLYYTQYQNSQNIRFDINDNIATSSDTSNKLKYKGNIKEGTTIIKSNGQTVVCVTDGKNSAYKNYNESKVSLISGKACSIPSSTSIVYLDGEATLTELSNQELTDKVKRLEVLVERLQSEKASKDDLNAVETVASNVQEASNNVSSRLNTINTNLTNLTSTVSGHTTLISSLNSSINTLNSYKNIVGNFTFASGTTSMAKQTSTVMKISNFGSNTNNFTIEDGKLKVNTAGLYLVFARISTPDGITNGTYVDSLLYVGTTDFAARSIRAAAVWDTITLSMMNYCNAGSYIWVTNYADLAAKYSVALYIYRLK